MVSVSFNLGGEVTMKILTLLMFLASTSAFSHYSGAVDLVESASPACKGDCFYVS